MACFHPIPAYRTPSGSVVLWKEQKDSISLRLPCGGCLGCTKAKARSWALRCHLELQQHDRASFTTLTYDETHLPPTLIKSDLSTFLRRLRKASTRSIRFFACGEYGEQNERPHYHVLFYGLDDRDRDLIHDKWGKGRTQTLPINPARINYVAGYTAKKIGWKEKAAPVIDFTTGEILSEWQPPFLHMSRRPGIGAAARDLYRQSWRLFAVQDGNRLPVPRYLHEAWKATATPSELEDLAWEKSKLAALVDSSPERLSASEKIEVSKQSLQAARRNL